jgi:hypothetical protein
MFGKYPAKQAIGSRLSPVFILGLCVKIPLNLQMLVTKSQSLRTDIVPRRTFGHKSYKLTENLLTVNSTVLMCYLIVRGSIQRYSRASLIRNFGLSEQDVKKIVIRKTVIYSDEN